MSRRAYRWLLRGRVQGVGFRFFTRQAAQRSGVSGWVRNLADGRVEVEAAGDEEQLARFGQELESGPPAGRVAGVERSEIDDPPDWDGFEVRR